MILHGVIISLLFMISLTLPLVSFVLPVYKITKVNKLDRKKIIGANCVALGIIAGFNPEALLLYIFFYLPIEILYAIFNKYKKIKKLDRVIITSIITTIFLSVIIYILRDTIARESQVIMDVYRKNLGFTNQDINVIINVIKNNALTYIFTYSMITIYFVYIVADFKNYADWKVSFFWLLIYIVPFLTIKVLEIDNYYLENLKEIGQIIFIFVGIKTTYSFLNPHIKYRFMKDFLSYGLAITVPFLAFLVGVWGAYTEDKKIDNK